MSKNVLQRCSQFIIFATLLCLPMFALSAERPDAGTTIGSLREQKLSSAEKSALGIEVDSKQQNPAPAPSESKIMVNGIRITGQNIYSEDKLLPLVNDAVGKPLTLGELEILARQISTYFHDHGYFLAKALIPVQDVKDGVVEITVVVGRYGRIDIRNQSALSQGTINGLLSPLKGGDYIRRAPLERALLLLSDVSGVSLKTTIAPGKEPGTSNLILEISDTARFTSQLYADNWGNRFTGAIRSGMNVNINNPGALGDVLKIGGIYAGSGLNDLDLAYTLPVGPQGARIGVGYSCVNYLLGKDYADLDASGQAKVTTIYESYPLIRSRDFNLYGRIGYDSKKLEDRIDYVGSNSNKKAGVLSIGLSGDNRDSFGNGVTGFSLTFASGKLTMNSADAQTNDTEAQTAGNYNKTTINLLRQKYMNKRLNYSFSFTGQLASKNLDSSEKIFLGGASGVRAYPQGEAAGDEGYLVSGELHWNLPTPQFQLVAFLDNGRVILNKNPWDASVNKRILTGAGLGLIFSRPNDYTLCFDYAWKLTSDSAVSDTDESGRFWVRGIKYF